MKDIEQYLRENAPHSPEEDQFLIETNARLDAVEGIKKVVDGENRRWRITLMVTLATGLALGSLVTLLALFYPAQPSQAAASAWAKALEAVQGQKEILMGFVAVCAVALGVLSLSKRREAL